MTTNSKLLPHPLRRITAAPEFRQVLLYSLPALALGVLLRAILTARMPWGYVQYDTSEYLETAFRLLKGGAFFVDGKRGFLVPIAFTLPFLLHIPALIAIPIGQHLLGLLGTLFTGGLVRLWFRAWRWFIIPATLLFAANPMMLWYEQTIMGESEFLFALVLLAFAGTLWVARQSPARFAGLIAALICAAGARPEGKAYFAFGLLLVTLVLWKKWRPLAKSAAWIIAVAVAWSLIVRPSTAPQLLYASLIQLAPDHSRLLPGVEPYIIPLRDQVRSDSGGDPQQLVKVSKRIRDCIDPYLWLTVRNKHAYYPALNRTLRDLCIDAILAHPIQAIAIPIGKFRVAADAWSAYQFNAQSLQKNQTDAYQSDPWLYQVLGRGLTGAPIDTPAAMRDFVQAHYSPASVAWLGSLQTLWNNSMIALRTPDHPARHPRWVHDFAGGVPGGLQVMPGIPLLYPVALLAMLLAMALPSPSRRFHLAWVPIMLAVWYLATLVGVTNARYRFAYEPFCLLYILLLADFPVRHYSRTPVPVGPEDWTPSRALKSRPPEAPQSPAP